MPLRSASASITTLLNQLASGAERRNDRTALRLAAITLAMAAADAESAPDHARMLLELTRDWLATPLHDDEARQGVASILEAIIHAHATLLDPASADMIDDDERRMVEEGLHRCLELLPAHLLDDEARRRAATLELPTVGGPSELLAALDETRARLGDRTWIRIHRFTDPPVARGSLLVARYGRDTLTASFATAPERDPADAVSFEDLALRCQMGDDSARKELRAHGVEPGDAIREAARRSAEAMVALSAIVLDGQDPKALRGRELLLSTPPQWLRLPWGAMPLSGDGNARLCDIDARVRIVPMASLRDDGRPSDGAVLVRSADPARNLAMTADTPIPDAPDRGTLLSRYAKTAAERHDIDRSTGPIHSFLNDRRIAHVLAHATPYDDAPRDVPRDAARDAPRDVTGDTPSDEHPDAELARAARPAAGSPSTHPIGELNLWSLTRDLLAGRRDGKAEVGTLVLEVCQGHLASGHDWRRDFASVSLALLAAGAAEVVASGVTLWPGDRALRRYWHTFYGSLDRGVGFACADAARSLRDDRDTRDRMRDALPSYWWAFTPVTRLDWSDATASK